ncbi:MAG: hypothetical protein DMD26_17000 [Gemmatimonadetes bacterium]|nr:MAG: hypothetical protein DMD26_17000 [Gemmatimonadota bacterium]
MEGHWTGRIVNGEVTPGIERKENESERWAMEQSYLTMSLYRFAGLGAKCRHGVGQYDVAFGAGESVDRGFAQSRLGRRHAYLAPAERPKTTSKSTVSVRNKSTSS